MHFDISLLKSDKIKSGITDSDLNNPDFLDHLRGVNTQAQSRDYGFINILDDTELIDKVKQTHQQFSWAKHLVVVGIGGSDLGARTLEQSLAKNDFKVSFVGNSTDPHVYHQLFSTLNPQETIVNVISKSGSTTETMTGFLLIKKFYQDHNIDWTKHFIFTTDPKIGILEDLSKKLNIATLPAPQSVDGRFSVLTPVGLLPAIFMGIDIDALLNSAHDFTQKLINDNTIYNPAWLFALQNYLFDKKYKLKNIVVMPYSSQLELFANWFRQIWAESLGKQNKGFLPIKAIGPADQHSQLQYYNEGQNLNTYLFISLKKYSHEIFIDNKDVEKLSYLDGLSLSEIIKHECNATRFSLATNNRPSSNLVLDDISEKSIGELFMFFELATVYAAKLLNIPFSGQPGVEQSKKYIYSFIGRPGFEQYQDELKRFS